MEDLDGYQVERMEWLNVERRGFMGNSAWIEFQTFSLSNEKEINQKDEG